MLQMRPLRESDWEIVTYLASDEVQEGDHSGSIDGSWIANRRHAGRYRQHAVLEADGSVVGYCAIERVESDPAEMYRVFLVTDWSTGQDDKALGGGRLPGSEWMRQRARQGDARARRGPLRTAGTRTAPG